MTENKTTITQENKNPTWIPENSITMNLSEVVVLKSGYTAKGANTKKGIYDR